MILRTSKGVTVYVPVARVREILTVHKDGIIRRGQGDIVYVIVKDVEGVKPDSVEIRELKTGYATGNRVEVLSGLGEGEMVVVRGNERLRPGQVVGIAESL